MKLFCFDIDQTLLPLGEYEIPREEKESLQALLNNGHAIALASGRPFKALKHHLADLVGDRKFYVCANGAVVYNQAGDIIQQTFLTSEDFLYLSNKYLNDQMTIYAFEESGGILCHEHDKWVRIEQDLNLIPDEQIHVVEKGKPINGHDHLLKIMFAGDEKVIERFSLDEKDEAKYDHCMSMPTYFEMLQKGTSKGSGVDALRKSLGLSPEDVYCFGDQDNDIPMVSMFNGVAMGNAIPKLKKVAKYVTKTDKEHGVTYALKHILKVI